MQISLFDFIQSLKPVYGYTGNNNGMFSCEDLKALANGGQVKTESKDYGSAFYFSTPYNDAVRLVYSVCNGCWDKDPEPRPADAKFCGFMFGGNLYTDFNAIRNKYIEDVNAALLDLVPDENAALRYYKEDHEGGKSRDNTIDAYIKHDYSEEARSFFFDEKVPELHFYGDSSNRISKRDLITYIQDPAAKIEKAAHEFLENHTESVYVTYIRYNRIVEALHAIQANPDNDEHKILKMRKSISSEKTVRLELTTGQLIRVEANAIKYLSSGGHYISSYYILPADRDKVPKNKYNRPDDIYVSQIKAIHHGTKVLYAA